MVLMRLRGMQKSFAAVNIVFLFEIVIQQDAMRTLIWFSIIRNIVAQEYPDIAG